MRSFRRAVALYLTAAAIIAAAFLFHRPAHAQEHSSERQIRIVLLVCSMSTPRAECTQETAYSVTQAGFASTPNACLSEGQIQSARSPLSDGRVYSKVVCERVKS